MEQENYKVKAEDRGKITEAIYKDLYDQAIEGQKDQQHSFNSISGKSNLLFGFLVSGIFALIGYSYANTLDGLIEYVVFLNLCIFVKCLIILSFNLVGITFPKTGVNLNRYFINKIDSEQNDYSPFLLRADDTEIIHQTIRINFIERCISYDDRAQKVLDKMVLRHKIIISILTVDLLISALVHLALMF